MIVHVFVALLVFSSTSWVTSLISKSPTSYFRSSIKQYSSRLLATTESKAAVNVATPAIGGLTISSSAHNDAELVYESVHSFGKNQAKSLFSKADATALLGGKGANLATMGEIGLSVPPGFTITTECCAVYLQQKQKRLQASHQPMERSTELPAGVWPKVLLAMKEVEKEMEEATGIPRRFGDPLQPLLVSCRSGAAISMPGMLDTVLNLGLNDTSVQALAAQQGGEQARFAYDSYRRFLHMFGSVVMDIPHGAFEDQFHALKAQWGVLQDNDLSTQQLTEIIAAYKAVYVQHGKTFLQDPFAQLQAAILAVFDSWNSERAVKYRAAEGITGLLGTGVTIQSMVFGNRGDESGTGVCFTRDPNTGAKLLYGEYLLNAQGEDVVAGIRTPLPIASLQTSLPEAYDGLIRNVAILEKHYGDMQDIEFTIQDKKLFMLQTRGGKRTGAAAVRIAVDLVEEKLATKNQALLTVKSSHLKQLLHPQFRYPTSKEYKTAVIAKGLPASPGAAVGKMVFTPEKAEAAFAAGVKCILVRDETSPEDVGGMWSAEGLLTLRGGMTSHAAVVARGWGKPCICGTERLIIDEAASTLTVHFPPDLLRPPLVLHEGDVISLNGETGEVLGHALELAPPDISNSDR